MVAINEESGPACGPTQLAANAVAFMTGPGGSHVELRAPGLPALRVCVHPNPAVVRDQAEALRRFLAAIVRADRQGRRGGSRP
jgi:hypothetical protein